MLEKPSKSVLQRIRQPFIYHNTNKIKLCIDLIIIITIITRNDGSNGRINKPRDPKLQDKYVAYQQNIEQQLASQEKKQAYRRITDHGNNMGRWYIEKSLGLTNRSQQAIGTIRPESSYLIDLLPSLAYSSSFNLNRRNNKTI